MCNLLSLSLLFPFTLPALSFPAFIFVFRYLFALYSSQLSSHFPLQDCSHQMEQEHCLPSVDLGKASIAQVFYKLCQSLCATHCRHRQTRHIDSDHQIHIPADSKPLHRIHAVGLSHHIPLFHHLLRSLVVRDCVAEHTFTYQVDKYNSAAKLLVVVINLEVRSVTNFAVGH